jgi:hypothetical protein
MSETPYLTAAASIGMTTNDITLFIKRLDKVLAEKTKRLTKAALKDGVRKTSTPTPLQAVDALASLVQKMPISEPPSRASKTPTHELVGRKTPTPKIGQLPENQARSFKKLVDTKFGVL